MKITEMNWMQVEAYLKGDDRAVVPIGSTEQHGQLSLGVDLILSERVSVEADRCEIISRQSIEDAQCRRMREWPEPENR